MGETPDNFIVKEYVPQPQILDRASVFISHGGMGGISEAMVSNVRTARLSLNIPWIPPMLTPCVYRFPWCSSRRPSNSR